MYLGDKETLPIIISTTLSLTQEDMLLAKLKKHQGTIGWTLMDIKGIIPSLCMHKIQLEGGQFKSIEQQRLKSFGLWTLDYVMLQQNFNDV